MKIQNYQNVIFTAYMKNQNYQNVTFRLMWIAASIMSELEKDTFCSATHFIMWWRIIGAFTFA